MVRLVAQQCEYVYCHWEMVKRVLCYMLFTPNFLTVGQKTRVNRSSTVAPSAPWKSRLCPSKPGMAPSSPEKLKVRHCNTKITVTELIIVIIVILLGNGGNCDQNLYGNLYGRTKVHGQLKRGRDGEAGLGQSNMSSQSHNNEITGAWLQEETGQRRRGKRAQHRPQVRELGVKQMCLCSLSSVRLLATNPVDCSPPGSSVQGFPRQEYWSRWSFPSPGDLSRSGIEPSLLHRLGDSSPTEPPGKPNSSPVWSKPTGTIFSIAFGPFVSLCHILVILRIFQAFSSLLYFLWWPVISDPWCYHCKKIMTCWRLSQRLSLFSNILKIKVWTLSF